MKITSDCCDQPILWCEEVGRWFCKRCETTCNDHTPSLKTMQVSIKNWRDLVKQFGYNDNEVNGCKGAKRIYRELKEKIIKSANIQEYVDVDCKLPDQGEAIVIFHIVPTEERHLIWYEYQGTAN